MHMTNWLLIDQLLGAILISDIQLGFFVYHPNQNLEQRILEVEIFL